jgi:hypothetical protein
MWRAQFCTSDAEDFSELLNTHHQENKQEILSEIKKKAPLKETENLCLNQRREQ